MALESVSGRSIRWLAHSESVIIDGPESYLLDTPPFTKEANPSLHKISDVTWATENQNGPIRHPDRDVALRNGELSEPELVRRYGPPLIRSCHHLFDVYPFDEGLEMYQQKTNDSIRRIHTRQDYAEFYYSAIAPIKNNEPVPPSELAASA